MEWRQIQGTSTTSSMTTEQNNHVLTAINAAMVSFTQQIVEQATKPLTERIARLEQQQEELYDIIKISLKGHVNNAVNISIASVKQDITKEVLDIMDSRAISLAGPINKFDVIRANVLDAVDEKIEEAISKITTDSITGFSEAVEEVLQNQPPLNADDIVGLDDFVKSELDEHLDTHESDRELVNKIRDAFQAAADSL